MSTEHNLIVDSDNAGIRLDLFISEQIEELSRSYVSSLISKELVFVNSEVRKSGYSVKLNDIIRIIVPEPQILSTEAEDIPIDIIYEDDVMAVINKSKGMVVHPAAGSYNGTLVNALLFHLKSLSSINGVIRPGIVHRLDKDTSGLLVIAKNDQAHISLQEQISSKSALRIYRAIVDGNVKIDEGSVIEPIGRNKHDRKKMAVVSEGRFAHTDYKVLERFKNKCYMEFSLKTGRTHQIRVHMKHIGHPITGDVLYGGDLSMNKDGQLLHAYQLILNHPVTLERMEFYAPLPEGFTEVLEKLRKTI